MSICTPCVKTLPVLFCSTNIYVADWIAGVGVDVQVWYMNTANGRVGSETITTGVDGKITIVFDGRMEKASYEVWINESIGKMMARDAFYIPETTDSVTCITVNFDRAYDDTTPLTVAESTIEAA